jgi:hypothetical protein
MIGSTQIQESAGKKFKPPSENAYFSKHGALTIYNPLYYKGIASRGIHKGHCFYQQVP